MSDIEINSSIKDYFVNFCDHKKVIEKYRDEEDVRFLPAESHANHAIGSAARCQRGGSPYVARH